MPARQTDPRDEFWEEIAWVEQQSLPLSQVQLAVNIRTALNALSLKLDGGRILDR